jgi:very-short-patch-repair endonuclease
MTRHQGDRPGSVAEQLLAVQLEQAGIPFRREFRFAEILDPPRKWRADFAIGAGMYDLLIECEGGLYIGGRHSRGAGFEKDLDKYNAAAELGYRVLRYSPRQINDGSALEQIRRILSMKEEAA